MNGKTVIITGAGSGIGRAAALKFAQNGANVVISDINETTGRAAADEVEKAGGRALFVLADTSIPEDNERLTEAAVKHFGKLDCAVNNAGIGSIGKRTANYDISHWDKVISVNLSGVFYGMQPQLREMLKTGGGAIVNISSVLGVTAYPGSVAYIAAKHGVIGLTKTAAVEYAKGNIRVNAVGPGYTETPLLSRYDEEKRAATVARHPVGRLGKAEEIANLIYWLCSDEASFVTGAYYPADGGYTAW